MKLACNAFRRPRSWDKRNFRIILGRKICSGRRVQVSISPTRAEGYPFVKRYPYRMLRRATWLKAASCVPPILPPPLSFFLFSFFLPSSFSPRSTSNIWCDTRENIPSQRNWLAFLRKWGKEEGKREREREENSTFPGIPTEFYPIHRWWIQEFRYRAYSLFVSGRWLTTMMKKVTHIAFDGASFLSFSVEKWIWTKYPLRVSWKIPIPCLERSNSSSRATFFCFNIKNLIKSRKST